MTKLNKFFTNQLLIYNYIPIHLKYRKIITTIPNYIAVIKLIFIIIAINIKRSIIDYICDSNFNINLFLYVFCNLLFGLL